MHPLRPLDLTVLALRPGNFPPGKHRNRCDRGRLPRYGKIAAKGWLVRRCRSCILDAYPVRRLASCPKNKRLHEPSASTSGRTNMRHHALSPHVLGPKLAIAALLATTLASSAYAQKKYDPGATDAEIKVGNIMPYSGPASSYATIGKTEAAYFNKLNSEGGINGRKINFISYDDGYSPPKAVEQARKLVESDEALLVFNPLGTANNTAIQKYMNSKKVPQLFVATGATKFNDPKDFPWTMGWQPSYQSEAHIYAKYLMKEKPDAKIAVFYQNDDFGKDYLKGLKDALGAKASMITAEGSYETSEPTIDNHIVKLKATGADVFISITTPKFAAQAIKKIAEIDWKP